MVLYETSKKIRIVLGTPASSSSSQGTDESSASIKLKLGAVSESSDGYLTSADYVELKSRVSKKQSIAYAICLRR